MVIDYVVLEDVICLDDGVIKETSLICDCPDYVRACLVCDTLNRDEVLVGNYTIKYRVRVNESSEPF